MDRLIGRAHEMDLLNSSFGEPSALLIFGRRRIGKIILLEHFCEGRSNPLFTCVRGGGTHALLIGPEELFGYSPVPEI